MHKFFVLILLSTFFQKRPSIVNATWTYDVTKDCRNILTFKSGNKVIEYNCELDYKLKGTYRLTKDTVLVTIKDDSHPEDGGKAYFYRYKYIIVKNRLIAVEGGELIHRKWKYEKIKFDLNNGYKRAN